MTLVQSFKTGSYKLTRQSGNGTYADGYYVEGAVQTSAVSGSMQVARPRDTQVLPEGLRVLQSYKFYTDAKLNTVQEVGQKLADRIEIYGQPFVVMQSERWDGTDLPYFKALCVRENLETEVGEK